LFQDAACSRDDNCMPIGTRRAGARLAGDLVQRDTRHNASGRRDNTHRMPVPGEKGSQIE
jgi:hypothetical protein